MTRGRKITIEEFWDKIDRSGGYDKCWNWISGVSVYGTLTIDGKNYRAHRVAWIFTNGKLSEDIDVLHSCDNPRCCNPNHLFLGNDKDNSDDKISKGRFVSNPGEKSWNHKLFDQDIFDIRKKFSTGNYRQCQLANEYKVDSSEISRIVNRKNWRHI